MSSKEDEKEITLFERKEDATEDSQGEKRMTIVARPEPEGWCCTGKIKHTIRYENSELQTICKTTRHYPTLDKNRINTKMCLALYELLELHKKKSSERGTRQNDVARSEEISQQDKKRKKVE
jgi:hypothetical protein